jgi:hypothetical protein
MRNNRTKYQIIVFAALTMLSLLTPLSLSFNTGSPIVNVGSYPSSYFDQESGIVSAFASADGLVRCSDGKLVGSPGECPATDQCPPPQNNTVSNCVPGVTSNGNPPEGLNLTSNQTNSSAESELDSQSDNTTTRCYEDRSTPHTPRCDDDSNSSS